MEDSFDVALNFVLEREGGYSDDSTDPGGETNFGISKRAFPNVDIKSLTKESVRPIYKEHYWNACECDEIPSPLDIVIFDTAVNMGVGTAKEISHTSKSVDDYLFNRISKYCDRVKKNFALLKYLRGWVLRVIDLRKIVRG